MFETIIICETGGAYQQNITNFSNIQDIIEGDTFKAPVELVGGKYQVKPYFDYDPVRDTDFDTNIFVMDCKQNIQLLFDLPNDLDIKYVNRTYKKDDKTKYSYHFMVDNNRISYYNIPALITKKGMQEQFKELDTSVYSKNRGLYPIYSSIKRTTDKNKPYIKLPAFKPENHNDDITKYFVSYIEEDFKDWDVLFPKKETKSENDDMFNKALNLSKNKCDDGELEFVRKLVLQCLSYYRAEKYDDWIKLGLCLHNIDYSLLDLWDEFSQNGSSYKSGECQDLWDKFDDNGKLTLGSLKYWAKLDNKIKYDDLFQETIYPFVDKSIRSDGSHSDVSEVISQIFKDKIIYDSKTKAWYIVNNKTNIWEQDREGVKVRLWISTLGCNIYLTRTQYWNSLQSEDEVVSNTNSEKAKIALKIASLLKNAGYKDSILKELKCWCINDDFKNKHLNKNYHLFAFNNCLFDCNTKQFRNIEPNDYIMKNTGYDFDFDSVNDEYVTKIEDLLKDILNTNEKYEYFIDINSQRLFGRNIFQEFYIFTGSGSNGKSLWYSLHSKAMGGYCDKLNPETFTKQAKTANQTSELGSIEDCRSCIIEEPNEEEKLINKTLKELSGGTYKARGLYQEAEEKSPQFALIFLCNDIPDMQKAEEAIARRVRVIKFDNKYCENPVLPNERIRDVSLTDLFKDDINYAKAYIKILIENWRKKDLTKQLKAPDIVKEDSKQYLDDSNAIKNFIEMYYEKTPDQKDRISTPVLFADYCSKIGKISNKTFVKSMKDLGFNTIKSCGKMYYLNIKHKSFEEDEDL